MQTIDVRHLAEVQSNDDVMLIDVRMPSEYREVHARGAVNVPLDSIDPRAIADSRDDQDGSSIYVICQSGQRSAKAAKKFAEAGFEQVTSVEGGTKAWEDAGLPVEKGKKSISLERQVRIAAGSIALIGSLAAMLTGNVIFAGIPAFIGAGLAFAGITDTCGMGMMLAKMPWNR